MKIFEWKITSVITIGDSSTSFSSLFFKTSFKVAIIESGFNVLTTFNKYYLSVYYYYS